MRILFKKGTHHGYKFDANGKVLQTKTETLGNDSGADCDTTVKVPGNPWLFANVKNGLWAGYRVPLDATVPGDGTYDLRATIKPKIGVPVPVPDPDPDPEPTPEPEPEPTPVPPGSVVQAGPSDWINKWASIPAGSTLQLASGTYRVGAEYGMDEVKSGEQGKPIIIQGGTGVVFDGGGARMGLWLRNAHDLIWRDIRFTNYRPRDTGVITFEYSQRVNFERITIIGCVSPNPRDGYSNDHGFYFGSGDSDCWVINCNVDGGFVGNSTGYMAGGAVHVWHAPGPVNCGVRGGKFTKCNYGVMWDQNGSGNKIEGGADFRGNRYGSVKTGGSGVTVSSDVLK